ncbi:MAG: nucleotidyltransferase domain-containing protein [Nanoarchaeota archaeon]|mgnify:CR=1 FL=1
MRNRYNSLKVPLLEQALQFFLKHPSQEVYLREYGRILKISPNSAQRFLNSFVAQGYLLEQRKGHLRFFKANTESIVFRQAKVLFSLQELQKSGIIGLLKNHGVTHVVLFGSVAQGTDDEQSDIDVVVITPSKQEVRKYFLEVQKHISRELSVQMFSWSEWKQQEKNNKAFYRDVLMNGISLIGEKPLAS